MKLVKYGNKYRDAWENFVDQSFNGTFMHKRAFLEYHGDKFQDCSLLIYKNDRLCAVFPAACVNDKIISHPGLTVAGLIYNSTVRGHDILEILIAIKEYFDYATIEYKNTPVEFHRHAVQDDIWALYNLNATKKSCELSSVLNPLMTNYEYWPERKKELSSLKNNISLSAMNLQDSDLVNEFWNSIVIPNLQKHNTTPIHSADDITYLYNHFPVFVKGLLARHSSGKMLGGLIVFRFNKCYHVQYSVTNSKGRALHAMSLLHHYMIEHLPTDIHYYNFGKSTENGGRHLNVPLYYYKNGFGGGSLLYETYEY